MFTRPARSAGSAVKTATAAGSGRAPRAAGAGRARSASASPARWTSACSSSGAIAAPASSPSRPRRPADRQVLADEQRDDAAGREADRLQQPDLAPLGEHAAADHGRDREADGDQRQQRVDADDERVRARLVGDRVAHLVPVDEAPGAARERAPGGGVEGVGGLGVGEPDADAAASAPARPAPRRSRVPARVGGLLGRDGEAGDRVPASSSCSVPPTLQAVLAGEAALDAAPRRRRAGSRPSVTCGRSTAASGAGQCPQPESTAAPASGASASARGRDSAATTPGRLASARRPASLSSP